jgi:DNA-binding NarL/FixJ family response regulator
MERNRNNSWPIEVKAFEPARAGSTSTAILTENLRHILQTHEKAWAAFRRELNDFLSEDEVVNPALGTELSDLTRREREILEYIARGLTNRQIANLLLISEKTVRNHVTNIFSRLSVAHRSQAIVLARKAGLGRE